MNIFVVACVLVIALTEGGYSTKVSIVISPEDISTSIGHTLLLPCVVAATNDSAAVVWKHNGSAISSTSLMSIREPVVLKRSGVTLIKSVLEICVSAMDVAGEYSCMATYMGRKSEETFRINVNPLASVHILVAPADLEANLTKTNSHTIVVLCAATGKPQPHITWLQNGHPLSNNSFQRIQEREEDRQGLKLVVATLEICALQSQRGGQYTCRARNQYTSAETSFVLSTPVAVADSSSPAVQNATLFDSNHELSCDFYGYPPPRSLGWVFNNQSADSAVFSTWQTQISRSGEIITRSSLSFNIHSVMFSGKYTCTAGSAEFTYQVHVQVAAQVIAGPAEPTHRITSSVFLSCVAYGLPAPQLTWELDDESTLSDRLIKTRERPVNGLHVVTSILELCPMKEETSSGQYSCQVENGVSDPRGASTKSVKFDLCFIGNFGLLVVPDDLDIVKGGLYYLPCVAYSKNNRSVTITWTDASGTVINSETSKLRFLEKNTTRDGVYFLHSVLEIGCASVEDATKYTCTATDGIESSQANFTVQFTFAPTIQDVVNERQFTGEGRNISFSCVVRGQPLPNVTWLKDGKPLQRNVVISGVNKTQIFEVNSTLYLFGLTEEDSGLYKCRGENRLGEVEMTVGYNLTHAVTVEKPGSLQNSAISYASYTGSVLCIFPLVAVATMHTVSKQLRSMVETIPVLNFCIATSILYIFYIPSSSGPWSHSTSICALFSVLFHVSFLVASFSISNLVFLWLHRVKKMHVIVAGLLLNWGLPLLILVVSISPNVDYYMNGDICIPVRWPLWLGLLFPFVAAHIVSWVILLFSPFIISKSQPQSDKRSFSTGCNPLLKEVVAIGWILFLFELAWGLQIVALSVHPATAIAAVLQSAFIVSSTCLGLVALLHFCFLQLRVRRVLHPSEKCSPAEEALSGEKLDSISAGYRRSVKVITVPVRQSFGEEVVNKLVDL